MYHFVKLLYDCVCLGGMGVVVQVEGRPAAHKQWALCIFDDVLEFASSVSDMLCSVAHLSKEDSGEG